MLSIGGPANQRWWMDFRFFHRQIVGLANAILIYELHTRGWEERMSSSQFKI